MNDQPVPNPPPPQRTTAETLLGDLNAGLLVRQINRALSDVAEGVVNNRTKGKVLLEFTMVPIGGTNSSQVELVHALTYTKPTETGKVTEVSKTSTPVHVGARGRMTLYPETQVQMFNADGSPRRATSDGQG